MADATQFVGTWKLISVEDTLANGVVEYPYGRDPAGLLVYDSSGRMAVQIVRRNRPRLSSDSINEATAEEIKAAADGFTAFFGTYTVDEVESKVTHLVEGHLSPNSIGKNLVREYQFIENRLILRPSVARTIVWERVSRT
ncbi:MAG TPA: lipocalin-like domain-containing protein [Blastocatellia bacterium]|nr:lipocalin-like domain-containing protein [Blastocatellia bacterium]